MNKEDDVETLEIINMIMGGLNPIEMNGRGEGKLTKKQRL